MISLTARCKKFYYYDTPSLEDLQNRPSRAQYAAMCTSPKCTPITTTRNGITKNVSKDTDQCPDCGYFLVWYVQKEKKYGI